jgi:oxalate decarboxylase
MIFTNTTRPQGDLKIGCAYAEDATHQASDMSHASRQWCPATPQENSMNLSRRNWLVATTAGGVAAAAATARAASFGNPDEPPQGAINAKNPASLTDPGPQNPAIASQFPGAGSPPATDIGNMPLYWATFNNAPKRTQNGGWARQVTQPDFNIAESISGVNMRLTSGGLREMHWHLAAEWAYMTYGNCRITVLDPAGQAYVADVKEGDLWYFPSGYPHSLQGTGTDGCEFIIAFDDGKASEFNTLLMTDWIGHTPPDVLAANFGVAAESFKNIPLHDLYIFQSALPGPLAADQKAVLGSGGLPKYPFTFSLKDQPFRRQTKGGTVQIADSNNFNIAKTVASALVNVRPGGLREMHWHPNADEWLYVIKGKAQVTVFAAGPNAVTTNFSPGDIGYILRGNGHYIKNVGDSDLVFLEVFNSAYFADVSLSDWLTHTPPAMVAAHLNVDEATIASWPRDKPEIMPV